MGRSTARNENVSLSRVEKMGRRSKLAGNGRFLLALYYTYVHLKTKSAARLNNELTATYGDGLARPAHGDQGNPGTFSQDARLGADVTFLKKILRRALPMRREQSNARTPCGAQPAHFP
jgi:hypothetical protein